MLGEKRLAKIKEVVAQRQRDLVLVLEDIYDPHNAAAILRTADAYGIQKVYFVFDKVEEYSPKKVGKASSATANKWLDLEVSHSIEACLSGLKQDGYTIVSTLLDKEAESLYGFVWPEKIALVVGNEHAGLSARAIEFTDRKIYIPMLGMVQSLNVSVATAIVISEITRTRQGKNFQLKSSEQEALVEKFSAI